MKPLYKTTIIIWSDYSGEDVELGDLASNATDGDAYCSVQRSEKIQDPKADPDWDGTEFFDDEIEDTA